MAEKCSTRLWAIPLTFPNHSSDNYSLMPSNGQPNKWQISRLFSIKIDESPDISNLATDFVDRGNQHFFCPKSVMDKGGRFGSLATERFSGTAGIQEFDVDFRWLV